MQTDEQVGAGFIGQPGPVPQGDEHILAPGQLDVHAGLGELHGQGQGQVQGDLFFFQALGTDGAQILAAVAGIQDHQQPMSGRGTAALGSLARCQ